MQMHEQRQRRRVEKFLEIVGPREPEDDHGSSEDRNAGVEEICARTALRLCRKCGGLRCHGDPTGSNDTRSADIVRQGGHEHSIVNCRYNAIARIDRVLSAIEMLVRRDKPA